MNIKCVLLANNAFLCFVCSVHQLWFAECNQGLSSHVMGFLFWLNVMIEINSGVCHLCVYSPVGAKLRCWGARRVFAWAPTMCSSWGSHFLMTPIKKLLLVQYEAASNQIQTLAKLVSRPTSFSALSPLLVARSPSNPGATLVLAYTKSLCKTGFRRSMTWLRRSTLCRRRTRPRRNRRRDWCPALENHVWTLLR